MKTMIRTLLTTCVLALALPGAALAVDDRFDGNAFAGKGGFLPVEDEHYSRECGACHFVYSPGLLPVSSWQSVLSSLDRHFGEIVELSEAEVTPIRNYLLDNAADVSDYRGSQLIMESMPDNPPRRITEVPRIDKGHIVMRWLYRGGATAAEPHPFTNCNVCHRRAGEGSWAIDELAVPGLTKVIKSGDMF